MGSSGANTCTVQQEQFCPARQVKITSNSQKKTSKSSADVGSDSGPHVDGFVIGDALLHAAAVYDCAHAYPC